MVDIRVLTQSVVGQLTTLSKRLNTQCGNVTMEMELMQIAKTKCKLTCVLPCRSILPSAAKSQI